MHTKEQVKVKSETGKVKRMDSRLLPAGMTGLFNGRHSREACPRSSQSGSGNPSFILITLLRFISLALMAGCAVGPDFQRPTAPDVDRYTLQPLPEQTSSVEDRGGEAQCFVQDMDIPGQWWMLFHSKPLNDLIEQALKANPDLEAAQAALRVAWENVYAQRGAFFPSIEANFNPTRQKISNELTSPLANNRYIFN
ncbi:MAG: TolC family protein, partial [Syntrophobacteraceae bacterium]